MDSDILHYVETACKSFKTTPERVTAISRDINHGHHADDVRLRWKDPETAKARRYAWWMMRKDRGWSFPTIARFFQCNHTSVLQACKWVEADEERRLFGVNMLDGMKAATVAEQG